MATETAAPARPDPAPATLRDLGQAAAAAALAVAFWWIAVARGGFHFSPDSMSYASLARGFLSGHPFTGGILWQGAQPGRLQANWPPLYPALIALVHLSGPSLPRSEFLLSGASYAAAAAFAVLAVRRACGTCPMFALPILAGFAASLSVAAWGWTEPVLLALLGLHYWLSAAAMRDAAGDRPFPTRLLFAQALVAGLAFLDRYAAAPFLATALLLPAALALATRRPPADALRGTAAAVLGAALPVVPWTAAALALTGHLGDPYIAVPTPLPGLVHAALHAVHDAIAQTLAPSATTKAAIMAAQRHLLRVTLACTAVAAVLALASRRKPNPPARGLLPPAALALMLAVDAAAYTAVLLALRARYFFDAVGIRLMAPALYPALVALVVVAACVPWRLVREALVLPVGGALLLQGWHALPVRHAHVAASLAGPWCSGGPRGDCALFAWLAAHTTDADFIIGNAPFTINFQLGRTTEEVAAYPYNPKPAPADFARWAAQWRAYRPGGRVLIVLDADTGPIADASQPYGPTMAALWREDHVALADGLQADLVASGAVWRVLGVGRAAHKPPRHGPMEYPRRASERLVACTPRGRWTSTN